MLVNPLPLPLSTPKSRRVSIGKQRCQEAAFSHPDTQTTKTSDSFDTDSSTGTNTLKNLERAATVREAVPITVFRLCLGEEGGHAASRWQSRAR